MKFLVETSARHLHVTREDLDTLFGKGFQLSNKKNLSQPVSLLLTKRLRLSVRKAS